ncbi:unnamed protein product [Porites evermanni]|uniref:Uncharacterized protein n=1 Tax=Porites evermanni TaxID=104178 RepID=A0ABN8RM45_9CNID|nr:unnamed protein product [Porites evermanni]
MNCHSSCHPLLIPYSGIGIFCPEWVSFEWSCSCILLIDLRGSLREIFLTIGNTVQAQICEKLQEQTVYGLLVDNVADISNEEQMLPLVQYFDMELGRLECKFLFTANVLEKASSTEAATLHGIITDHLNILKIPLKNLRALATDGASVITGKTRSLAAQLKKDVKSLVAVPHTDVDLQVIKNIQTEVTQLWKIFENSPKNLATYLKVQEEMKEVTLVPRQDKLLALGTKKVPIKRLQSDLAEGGSLAFTDIKKNVDASIKKISKRLRDAAQVLTAMQVFDKTATPPKENGSDFTEYG